MEAMEQGLEIQGVTAIEDKLQDGVPDALNCLRKAGTKVWWVCPQSDYLQHLDTPRRQCCRRRVLADWSRARGEWIVCSPLLSPGKAGTTKACGRQQDHAARQPSEFGRLPLYTPLTADNLFQPVETLRFQNQVWMLTGDKVDTAINIGHSCSLLNTDMTTLRLCADDEEEEEKETPAETGDKDAAGGGGAGGAGGRAGGGQKGKSGGEEAVVVTVERTSLELDASGVPSEASLTG